MEKLVWFKCSNCGCLMFLRIHDLTKYCDGVTIRFPYNNCPYCDVNSESIKLIKIDNAGKNALYKRI